jgi:NAD(P)-dependent dehydrogenase (short-subunit alcohol dehydrogenase family)
VKDAVSFTPWDPGLRRDDDQEECSMSLFDLTGKVAVITGSSRGIGRAIAEAMADQGAKVVISSRKAEACREVADAINAKHKDTRAIVVPASISSKEALQQLVDETRRQLGRIDILVCNAASNPYYGPMGGISDDQFRKILENNVIANHWLIQMVAPEMIERKQGSIIIVSSIGGLKASAVIGAYNISKAADFQLARNLAAEFGPHQVRVNCIAPGLIRTDFARALWENPETLKMVTMHTPMQRIGEPHEIAGAAVFLASDASTFVTGQAIVVDGGSTTGVGL